MSPAKHQGQAFVASTHPNDARPSMWPVTFLLSDAGDFGARSPPAIEHPAWRRKKDAVHSAGARAAEQRPFGKVPRVIGLRRPRLWIEQHKMVGAARIGDELRARLWTAPPVLDERQPLVPVGRAQVAAAMASIVHPLRDPQHAGMAGD